MLPTARAVLDDCKSAWSLLNLETGEVEFRLLYISSLSLLRAVGHVLKKIESKTDDNHKKIIEQTYFEWKKRRQENQIFWEFIEKERNNILKEYEIGVFQGQIFLTTETNNLAHDLDDQLYCPITYGAFEGQDCRDVIRDAILWWEKQLTIITQNLA